MAYGPPRNPAEGDRWRDGKTVYRWQAGKGWVGDRLYRPPTPPRPIIPPTPVAPEPAFGPNLVALVLALWDFTARLQLIRGALERRDAEKAQRVDREAQAPRSVPALRRPSQTVEVHAPGFKPAPDPLASRGRRKPQPAPEFSPEFLAKLAAMKPTDRLVTVRPLRAAPLDVPGGGSSLSDIT